MKLYIEFLDGDDIVVSHFLSIPKLFWHIQIFVENVQKYIRYLSTVSRDESLKLAIILTNGSSTSTQKYTDGDRKKTHILLRADQFSFKTVTQTIFSHIFH